MRKEGKKEEEDKDVEEEEARQVPHTDTVLLSRSNYSMTNDK